MKKNISIGKTAFQSSLSCHSHHPKEAENVLSGCFLNGYAFHTAYEHNPWLIIDLLTPHAISEIIIHNRKSLEERCKNISVAISLDALHWKIIYTSDDIFYGKYNNKPLVINLKNIEPARFIRVANNTRGMLHLSYIEVLGYTPDDYIVSSGVIIKVDKKAISPKILDILLHNRYEQSELMYAFKAISPEDNILELGAGIGFISAALLKLNKVKSYTAIEANPNLIDIIKSTHALNGITNCKVINAAVANESSENISFFVKENFFASSFKKSNNSHEIKVNTLSFSDIIKSEQINFLICDIEGAEHDILQTDLHLITKIVIELHGTYQEIEKTITMLKEKGFHTDQLPKEPLCILYFQKQ